VPRAQAAQDAQRLLLLLLLLLRLFLPVLMQSLLPLPRR
jgi:hypothetical protein